MTERDNKIKAIADRYGSCPTPSPAVSRRGKPHTTVDLRPLSPEERLRRDEYFMSCALELARLAAEEGEVPVGAVIVRGNEILAADCNGRETYKNALYHAETAAIGKACHTLGGWRLPGCELFVTLEPCIMCAGAVIQSRLPRIVFALEDERFGFFGSVADAAELPLNHKPMIEKGVLREESREILQSFFNSKRNKNT